MKLNYALKYGSASLCKSLRSEARSPYSFASSTPPPSPPSSYTLLQGDVDSSAPTRPDTGKPVVFFPPHPHRSTACRAAFTGPLLSADMVLPRRSCRRVQVADEHHWPEMRALILVVSADKKDTSSTSGESVEHPVFPVCSGTYVDCTSDESRRHT